MWWCFSWTWRGPDELLPIVLMSSLESWHQHQAAAFQKQRQTSDDLQAFPLPLFGGISRPETDIQVVQRSSGAQPGPALMAPWASPRRADGGYDG